MLDVMDKKIKSLSVRIAPAAMLLCAVAHGQSQNLQAEKTGGTMADLTPVTLSMKWARGDPHYGPNSVWLSTPCQGSDNVPCECTMEFKAAKSLEFADYISSFGDALVPVVYQVLYGTEGIAHSARLESVGSWQADKFNVNDRLLRIQFAFKGGKLGEKQKANFRAPADCFPPLRK